MTCTTYHRFGHETVDTHDRAGRTLGNAPFKGRIICLQNYTYFAREKIQSTQILPTTNTVLMLLQSITRRRFSNVTPSKLDHVFGLEVMGNGAQCVLIHQWVDKFSVPSWLYGQTIKCEIPDIIAGMPHLRDDNGNERKVCWIDPVQSKQSIYNLQDVRGAKPPALLNATDVEDTKKFYQLFGSGMKFLCSLSNYSKMLSGFNSPYFTARYFGPYCSENKIVDTFFYWVKEK